MGELIIMQSVIKEFITIWKILQSEGLDVTRIKQTITQNGKTRFMLLEDIKQGDISIQEIIERHNLDSKYPFGKVKMITRQAYKGQNGYAITEEDKEEIEKIGVMEKPKLSRARPMQDTKIKEFLRICHVLILEGYKINKIPSSITQDKKTETITLAQISQEGFNIGEVIEKHGLDANYPFGYMKRIVCQTYKGQNDYALDEEDRRKIEEYGILEKVEKLKANKITEFLHVCKILENYGVDLSKIPQVLTENGKKRRAELRDIKQENIDISKIIEDNGLDPYYQIGSWKTTIGQAYKGKGYYADIMTKEDRRELERMRVVKVGKKTKTKKTEKAKASKDGTKKARASRRNTIQALEAEQKRLKEQLYRAATLAAEVDKNGRGEMLE